MNYSGYRVFEIIRSQLGEEWIITPPGLLFEDTLRTRVRAAGVDIARFGEASCITGCRGHASDLQPPTAAGVTTQGRAPHPA